MDRRRRQEVNIEGKARHLWYIHKKLEWNYFKNITRVLGEKPTAGCHNLTPNCNISKQGWSLLKWSHSKRKAPSK
jgi:hypothetical protein